MEITNIFSSGLHRDNDPSGQPPNTYRDALNGSLVTVGENRFSFESVKGNTVSFTLPDHASLTPFTPIGWASFPDRLAVLSARVQQTGVQAGEIGQVIFNNTGVGTYKQLYYHNNLLSIVRPVSNKDGIVAKPENETTKRIYWTDNNSPLRSFNLIDSRIIDVNGNYNIVFSGSLVVGNKYMVLRNGANNSITYNGNVYGPGEAGLVGEPSSNVFTVVIGVTTYTGSAAVVEYIPPAMLAVYPVFMLGEILPKRFNQNGSLVSGTYQYFYQLGTTDGAYTNFSYVTREVSVAASHLPGANGIDYQNYQGGTTPPVN